MTFFGEICVKMALTPNLRYGFGPEVVVASELRDPEARDEDGHPSGGAPSWNPGEVVPSEPPSVDSSFLIVIDV